MNLTRWTILSIDLSTVAFFAKCALTPLPVYTWCKSWPPREQEQHESGGEGDERSRPALRLLNTEEDHDSLSRLQNQLAAIFRRTTVRRGQSGNLPEVRRWS